MSTVKKTKEVDVKEVETKEVETKKTDIGTSIYIGPSITGVIQHNTIYPCTVKEALKLPSVKLAIAEYTNIDKLIVDIDGSIEATKSLKDDASDMFKAYVGVKKK